MAYGVTPVDTSTTPIPLGCVIVPGTTTPKPLQGGPIFTDANSNDSAPAAVAFTGGFKRTYAAAITGLVLVTGATDVFTLTGSATTLVKITRVSFGGLVSATAVQADLVLLKRSSSNTG